MTRRTLFTVCLVGVVMVIVLSVSGVLHRLWLHQFDELPCLVPGDHWLAAMDPVATMVVYLPWRDDCASMPERRGIQFGGFAYFKLYPAGTAGKSEDIGHALRVPTVFLIAGLLAYPAFVFRGFLRKRRSLTACRCPQCTYDLTGNVSGVCPECGRPV